VKKRAVPMREGLVETVSSLGTGIKAKTSNFLSILKPIFGCVSVINEEVTSFCYDNDIDIFYTPIN
jgi:hypothetical protein